MKIKTPEKSQFQEKQNILRKLLPMVFGCTMAWACFAPFQWFTFTEVELFFISQSIVWTLFYVTIPIHYILTTPNLKQYVLNLKARWLWTYGCASNQVVPEIVIELVD